MSSRRTDGPQLRASTLSKSFGSEFRLSGVDFEVGADEIVALLGPSGCGKTTVLRCLAGVETPDSGRIEIGGDLVYGEGVSEPPERRGIGMVYQNYAIWPHKTVYGNVVFPLQHSDHDVPAGRYEDRVEEVLETVGIAAFEDAPATDLSGGQQQRTALARALVHDPDLLLLDEPLSNLDKELRKEMRYELQRLHHDLGVSMLYVTHDQEEAVYLADRIIVMRDGDIVERGDPRELYRRPTSAFTRRFLGERNRLPGTVETTPGGQRRVSTAVFDVPLGNVDDVDGLPSTGPVSCFVRPDDLAIGEFAGAADGRIELEGTVVAEGVLGDAYELTVRFDGTDVTLNVHTGGSREYDRGDAINIHVQPKTVQVYPREDDE